MADITCSGPSAAEWYAEMIKIDEVKLPIGHDELQLNKKVLSLIKQKSLPKNATFEVLRRSLDCRQKPDLFYVYSIGILSDEKTERNLIKNIHDRRVNLVDKEEYKLPDNGKIKLDYRPIVVGSGPAGLFCAYLLAQRGLKPIVIERGEPVELRSKTVEAFFKGEKPLNTESNVQFGEGGAGTFSDGKLNTLVKDKNHRNGYVLKSFVKFGAKEEITYVAKPHLGTDELRHIVMNMRECIISLGGEFRFNTKLVDITQSNGTLKSVKVLCNGVSYELDTEILVLAIGHSSRDTFRMLLNHKLEIEQKNFAVGLRIEHKQSLINLSQYGSEFVPGLSAADYKLTHRMPDGRSVYTFCMCPGGYVVNASSEEKRLCVNGMSYSGRNSDNANSAVIVTVNSDDFGSDDVLSGVDFAVRLEEKAYMIGEGRVPIQKFGDFESGKVSDSFGRVIPLTKGANSFANLRELFTDEINEAIIEGVHAFGRSIAGFDDYDSILSGVESRTSSPVRIVRDENFNSNIAGIYPCGEGAGYAGGITSAAMDGMKVAEAIILKYYRS